MCVIASEGLSSLIALFDMFVFLNFYVFENAHENPRMFLGLMCCFLYEVMNPTGQVQAWMQDEIF